jgi:hypothetical protein
MTNLGPAPNPGLGAMRSEHAVNGPPICGDKAAAAAYIAELTSTLVVLARGQDIETLAYLLDLARLEAETISHKKAASEPSRPSIGPPTSA